MSRKNSTTNNNELEQDNLIIDDSPSDNYTRIPNIIDDLPLSPQAHRLYCHFKRVAGERGACWQSTRTLARRCFISDGTVSNAKDELKEFGLITIEKKKGKGGGLDYDEIRIVNIWEWNHNFYSKDEGWTKMRETYYEVVMDAKTSAQKAKIRRRVIMSFTQDLSGE